jgi:hypothetical protein
VKLNCIEERAHIIMGVVFLVVVPTEKYEKVLKAGRMNLIYMRKSSGTIFIVLHTPGKTATKRE